MAGFPTPEGRGIGSLVVRVADRALAEHWDVLQDEATEAESQSGLPMFGTKFLG
jgi:predicted SnoaL-like aldol condensation-catalyzing enzyme